MQSQSRMRLVKIAIAAKTVIMFFLFGKDPSLSVETRNCKNKRVYIKWQKNLVIAQCKV